jgi:hypothetical protein
VTEKLPHGPGVLLKSRKAYYHKIMLVKLKKYDISEGGSTFIIMCLKYVRILLNLACEIKRSVSLSNEGNVYGAAQRKLRGCLSFQPPMCFYLVVVVGLV